MLSDSFLKRLDALALRMRHPAAGGSGGLRRRGRWAAAWNFRISANTLRAMISGAWTGMPTHCFDKLFLKLLWKSRSSVST